VIRGNDPLVLGNEARKDGLLGILDIHDSLEGTARRKFIWLCFDDIGRVLKHAQGPTILSARAVERIGGTADVGGKRRGSAMISRTVQTRELGLGA